MQLQREMYETSTELQRAANKYLDEQIKQAKNDSNSAGKQSKTAIVIASLGLISSVVFGIIQIGTSLKPNEQVNKQIYLLEKVLFQDDYWYKINDKKNDEIIEKITTLPFENYNSKFDLLYSEIKNKSN